jgi:hypothetical protein
MWKVLVTGAGMASALVLALTGKIDGAMANQTIQAAVVAFVAAAAGLGGLQAIGAGLAGRKAAPPADPPPAEQLAFVAPKPEAKP